MLLGQLQDAGNTTTLAHYLELLGGAGLVVGLSKHAGGAVRRRGSSPKLLALNTGLITAMDGRSGAVLRDDGPTWGRLVEAAVGAHLVNGLTTPGHEVRWWRDGDDEVDFVLSGARRVTAIEVKAGIGHRRTAGLEAFRRRFAPDAALVVGADGIDLEEFLLTDPSVWLTDVR